MKKLMFCLLIISSLFATEKSYKITQFYGSNPNGSPCEKSWKTSQFEFKGNNSSWTTLEFKVNNKRITISMPFIIEEQ